jgi:hypothetical protein
MLRTVLFVDGMFLRRAFESSFQAVQHLSCSAKRLFDRRVRFGGQDTSAQPEFKKRIELSLGTHSDADVIPERLPATTVPSARFAGMDAAARRICAVRPNRSC